MKKKLLSLLLVLCMLLTLAPAALADGDTADAAPVESGEGHFTDQHHAGLDFADMEYTPVAEEDFLAAVEDVRTLIADESNKEAMEEAFKKAAEMFMTIQANISLLSIRSDIDTTDEELSARYLAEYAIYVDIFDPFLFLVQDILKSPCKDYFVEQEKLTEDDINAYLEYTGMTDEEKELNNQLSGIDAEYWDAYATTTFEYEGTVYDESTVADAYLQGLITDDQYVAIADGLVSSRYGALGEVYMKAMSINKALAALDGGDYANYVEYAYDAVYGRGYDVETAQAFVDAVKEYVVPLYDDLYEVYSLDANVDFDTYSAMFMGDYSTDTSLATVRPYIAQMSDELLEAWDYMVDHHLYDIGVSETKANQGYTTNIPSFDSPFFFNSPAGYIGDFSTILHEFGHYNNAYWHAHGWNDGSCSMDVAEVHSQALELLFTQYYDDIFGDAAPWVKDLILLNIISGALINGAIYGELEIYAYSTEDVTLDMICDKYVELCEAYGSDVVSPYEWLEVHHLTIQPMYYISYATSAIGALYFYSYALENGFEAALEQYLEFVSQSPYEYYQDQFETVCGVDPMDPEYVAEIINTLYEDLDIENRMHPVFYNDVPLDSEYYDLVTQMTLQGVFSPDADGNFRTYDPATRAETAEMLFTVFYGGEEVTTDYFVDDNGTDYELYANWCAACGLFAGYETAEGLTFGGDKPITRQELTTVFCRAVSTIFGVDLTVADPVEFADNADIAPWAMESMQWYYANGMLPTDENGNVNPNKVMLRYHLASYANNIFYVFYNL